MNHVCKLLNSAVPPLLQAAALLKVAGWPINAKNHYPVPLLSGDTAESAIWATDRNGRITAANSGMRIIFPGDKLVGRTIFELTRSSLIAGFRKQNDEIVYRLKKPMAFVETSHYGSYDVLTIPIVTSTDELTGLVHVTLKID